MLVRGITLSLAALLAAGMLAERAEADHRPRRVIVEDDYYPGPAFIREVPGLRIFFGDYALTEEEFDELYGNGRRYDRRYDRRLEEPDEQVKPKRKAKKQQEKQDKKKTAAKPAKPAAQDKSASAGTGKQTDQAKSATKSAASGMSCEKATSVVSGYGFSSVTPSSCSGKVYAFNATRDGKSFAIKLDSGSGELTEVKKLP